MLTSFVTIDINEEQDDVEFDDTEDIDMNEAYEEQYSFKDNGVKDMKDLEKVIRTMNLLKKNAKFQKKKKSMKFHNKKMKQVYLIYLIVSFFFVKSYI
ncbi:hypothetical protein Hanom_Chr10g00942231 [Helianthus anomalus]